MEVVFKIFWTDFAINQLKDIFNYYSVNTNQRVAQRFVQRIIDSTLQLEKNPKSGKKEELLLNRQQEFRFLIAKNYKIFYWIDYEFNIINISMVFDTRQNPVKIKKI
jgi:plasmid stabilization system protein ParE